MKSFLFAFVGIGLASMAVTTGVYAQTAVNIALLEPTKDVIKTNKVINPEKEYDANLSAINIKAIRDFKKFYKKSTNEHWYKSADGFNAIFISDGVDNLIYYSKNGQWSGSLKVYGEDKLTRDIRNIVKRKYYDFTITSVQEIETLKSDNVPTYIVHLEDDKNIKLIRVSDGEMDIYKEFKKD